MIQNDTKRLKELLFICCDWKFHFGVQKWLKLPTPRWTASKLMKWWRFKITATHAQTLKKSIKKKSIKLTPKHQNGFKFTLEPLVHLSSSAFRINLYPTNCCGPSSRSTHFSLNCLHRTRWRQLGAQRTAATPSQQHPQRKRLQTKWSAPHLLTGPSLRRWRQKEPR